MNIVGIALDELYRIFGLLNATYFDGRLPEPAITIQRAKRPGNLGWFSTDKIWVNKADEKDMRHEINISAEHLAGDIYDIVDTLQHEMVHYSNRVSDIKDCNGNIHNKRFKVLAEQVGLICEKSKKYGWGTTRPSEGFRAYIDAEIHPEMEAFTYFRNTALVAKPLAEKKVFKYTCPTCDLVVHAKADKRIICGACDTELEMEE